MEEEDEETKEIDNDGLRGGQFQGCCCVEADMAVVDISLGLDYYVNEQLKRAKE